MADDLLVTARLLPEMVPKVLWEAPRSVFESSRTRGWWPKRPRTSRTVPTTSFGTPPDEALFEGADGRFGVGEAAGQDLGGEAVG